MTRLIVCGILGTMLCICCQEANAISIHLADIVGGGNGTGTGTQGHGIDPSTGGTTPPAMYQISQLDNSNNYHASSVTYVDGAFIPDGGAGPVTLDTAGHTFSGFPNTDSNSWDLIKYGPNQNSGTTLNGIDYNSGAHTMIGLHANKGITFDLQQIIAAHPGMRFIDFTATAGMSHIGGGYGTSDWWVFVDGVLKQNQANTPGGTGFSVSVPIATTDNFLTLVATDAGDGFSVDQVIFGDAFLNLQAVPEPSSVLLASITIGAFLIASRPNRIGEPRKTRNTHIAAADQPA